MEEYLRRGKKNKEVTPGRIKKAENKPEEKNKKRKKNSPLEENKLKEGRAGREDWQEEEEEEEYSSANEEKMGLEKKEMMAKLNMLLEECMEQKKYREETRGRLTNIENRWKEEKSERFESEKRMNKRIEEIEKAMREDKEEIERAKEEEKSNKIILGEEEGESSIDKKLGMIERRLGRLEDGKDMEDGNKGRDESKSKE